MTVLSVVGTRPNFVKEYLLNRAFREQGIREILVHTGQHYDYDMSQVFFENFGLPQPDHFLSIPNHDGISFTSECLSRLGGLIRTERPDVVLSYGDVNSTLAAAVAAAKSRTPFVHVEGGIRSVDLYNPEEINRRVADVLADLIFCCTGTDMDNLRREGVPEDRLVLSGDLMQDALEETLRERSIPVARGDYLVLTLHREENVSNPRRLQNIFEGLIRSGRRIVFPAHPRTERELAASGLIGRITRSAVELCKPMSYPEFVRLAAGADKILTDSGGVRREAYLLRKPCIVLIELAWFPEIEASGWKVRTGPDPDRIAELVRTFEPAAEHPPIFGDGTARHTIVRELRRRYGA